jgi:hypothetical protein
MPNDNGVRRSSRTLYLRRESTVSSVCLVEDVLRSRLSREARDGGGMKYLEPSHVLDQQPTGESIRHSQGREDVVDEMEERLCPGIATVPRRRVEDGIWLTGWGQEPEVGCIRCQILSGQCAYINL